MRNESKIKIDVRTVKMIIFCILQKILFEYLYIEVIFTKFQYYGFENNFDLLRYIISWIAYVPVPAFVLNCQYKETLSKQVVAFMLNVIYTPCLILFTYMNNTPFIIWIFVYYIVMILAVKYIGPLRFRIKLGNYYNLEKIILGIGYLLGIVIIFVWGYYAHFHIQINFSDVYVARMAARTFATPKIIIYMRETARGVIPLLLTYSLYKNKRFNVFYFTAIQIIQFFIDGSKSVIFILIIGIFVYYFYEKYNQMIDKIPEMMTIGAILAIVETKFFSTNYITSLIIRRVMFIPALINYYYYDFAQKYGFDYYRQSLEFLGESRYDGVIARIIGKNYFGNVNTNANNGLFADAYINLGSLGCFILPICIVLIFKLIEGAGKKVHKSVWAVCVIQAFILFTSSSFFTVLITHGILLMIIFLYNLSTINNECCSEIK